MALPPASATYKTEPGGYRSEGARGPSPSAPPRPTVEIVRPDWLGGVEDFLQLLARAVRQFHTYPETSPLCAEAVAAAHKALASLERFDRLVLRVTVRDLIVSDGAVTDEVTIGAGTIVEHELVRRLHKAHVAVLDVDRAASARDLTRLCTDIVRSEDLASSKTTFAELLAEHGLETITARTAHRPEVLDVGARPAPIWDLVARDRARRDAAAAGGPIQYLYPPEKGWVRLEPGAANDPVSLVDLAVLVDDPADIATMLLRLTDDDPEPGARDQALQQKFVDVATLFAALDGHLARVMFAKLARAVLAIEPQRRNDLLRRTILPGLLDGRADGAVLRDFPDPDLAESLCLLLELETAAPEVVTAALSRLDLPSERREAVVALVDERLRNGPSSRGDASRDQPIDRLARRLVSVDAGSSKSYAEFAAFDLSIGDQAAAAIAAVGPAIEQTDLLAEQLDFLWKLVRLEPNPTVVEAFMRRAAALLSDLARDGRGRDLAANASRFRQLAASLKRSRPDVADAIGATLTGFCQSRALALVDLHETGDDGRETAALLVEAFGDALAPSFVALLDDPSAQSRTRAISTLLCEHATALAPGLAARLGQCGVGATRVVVRVCGFAGAGYEVAVAEQLSSEDEQTLREALRALARIGSPRAASLVGKQIHEGSPIARAAAEEALWHFPRAPMLVQLRDLLGRREFVLEHPQVATRLIDRAKQAGAEGLDGILEEIEALRFRFWNPAVLRVAWKAHELRGH